MITPAERRILQRARSELLRRAGVLSTDIAQIDRAIAALDGIRPPAPQMAATTVAAYVPRGHRPKVGQGNLLPWWWQMYGAEPPACPLCDRPRHTRALTVTRFMQGDTEVEVVCYGDRRPPQWDA